MTERTETLEKKVCPLWRLGPCSCSRTLRVYCRQTDNGDEKYLNCGIFQEYNLNRKQKK